ncbi:fatty acid desaturase [Tabrizicola sp.]|uniref:acyl-CoA desaturase n=1 Tax=Tabrizicola sp. TaxID=2005166 RepID=UPI00286D0135|nr:fatty acid desaturase [Tabrizicola sp.]
MSLIATDRVVPATDTSATEGRIVWDAPKSLWWFGHLAGTIIAVTVFPQWDGVGVMLLLTALTVCAGHSVGMHRLLIHRTFEAPLWLERALVWLGTLVGMAGPMGMIRAHDMRDWHQRQAECPHHPSHGAGFWRDAWWQMHCRFDLAHPPRFQIEPQIADDPVLRLIERHWMAQQIPLAVILWALGGWAWVFWGISTRIVLSLSGHWAVGHFAHRQGHQGWRIEGLPVQGYNLPGLGLITFGENWHGNHHAFPHSARHGIEPGQLDPGFWFIRALETLGLARAIRLPDSAPPREGLTRVIPLAAPRERLINEP